MAELKELRGKLMNELKHHAGKELSFTTLDTIDKLAHSIKCIDKIMECHKEEVVVTNEETDEVVEYLQRAIKAMKK